MTLTPGTRLGAYEVIAPLGAGGMGAVYRARDPRLDREVAIKVLATELAKDPVALTRFEREAMSVAKLSHPNILSIFEFGHEGSTAFVVTELLQGETLRARLENGRLPARRAVAYALQIARGMAAAHARGVVHRDLKPENVMITTDDHVKILDFGLAKSVDAAPAELTRAGTVVTSAGTILGTFGYMAPEQVRGLQVDHRADMFAFGAVLYEMLSGERAFTGETAADTMTAVLTKDPPDLDTAALSIAPGLERIVRRCLEKTPDLRFQSANDLAFALETLATPSASTTLASEAVAPPGRHGRTWLPWVLAGLGVLAAVGSILMNGTRQAEPRWDTFTRITEAAGEETAPTLSPDGNTVAYAIRVNGSWGIYSQRVGGRNATPIVNDPERDESAPAFSPDGALIAFHQSGSVGGIFVAGATGESVRRVTDYGFDPAWSPDGKEIAFATEEVGEPSSRLSDSALYVVDVGGGSPRRVLEADAVQPSWSPSGERIVYWRNIGGQRDIYTIAAGGGTPIALTNDPAIDWSPVWSPDGRFIYFSSDRGGVMNLWRIGVDQSSGRPRGLPEPVTAGVQASAGLPRFSRDGSRLVFRARGASINPVAIPFEPATVRAGTPILLDTGNNIRIPSDVSPDGKQLVYYSTGEPQEDLFIGPVNGPMRRLTDDSGRDRTPMFVPGDGHALVFYSNRDGEWAVWEVRDDGSGLRRLQRPTGGVVNAIVSPKGDALVFGAGAGRRMFLAPLTAVSQPIELASIETDGKYFQPTAWSPDATRLAGPLVPSSGRPSGVAVYDIGARKTSKIAPDETFAVRWLADSRRVMYFTNAESQLVVLDSVSGRRTVVDVRLPGPSYPQMFAISPDNRTIYYGAKRSEADIWIVERK